LRFYLERIEKRTLKHWAENMRRNRRKRLYIFLMSNAAIVCALLGLLFGHRTDLVVLMMSCLSLAFAFVLLAIFLSRR
jgi:hypothetical protein